MILKYETGFTLVEIMVAIAIAAILAMMAAPSFEDYTRKNAVYADTKRFNDAVASARFESVSRNRTVSLCATADAENCGTDWSEGWMVFVDDGAGTATAKDGKREGDEAIITAVDYQGENQLSVEDVGASTDLSVLSFNEFGRPAVDGKPSNAQVLLKVCDRAGDARYSRGLLLTGSGQLVKTRDTDNDGVHDIRYVDGQRSLVHDQPLSCGP